MMNEHKVKTNLTGMIATLVSLSEPGEYNRDQIEDIFDKMLDGSVTDNERHTFISAMASDSELYDSYMAAKSTLHELLESDEPSASVIQFPTEETDLSTSHDIYRETLLPMAAAEQSRGPVRLVSKAQKWSIEKQEILGDSDNAMLVFECLTEPVSSYQNKSVSIRAGDHTYILGPVDRHGVAEVRVPADIDLSGSIDIEIR